MRDPRGENLLSHHELCFGCGTANLFGLQMELWSEGDGIAGRFFVKQDHQGPPGHAHGGILATALDEAMSVLLHSRGTFALTRSLELELYAPVPVGTFVLVDAHVERTDGRRIHARARARGGDDDALLAEAAAVFVTAPEDAPR